MGKRTYKLELLHPAQLELDEIARVHMALSGPQSAQRVTDELYSAMEQPTRFPLSRPMIWDEELRMAGYRYILAAKYLIFYRFLENTVFVYHIAHGATDYPKLSREEM